jgi:hypothetical protein
VLTQADESIQAWIASVVDRGADVSALPPSAEPDAKAQVRAYLIGLAPSPPPRERTPAFQLLAHYLITSWASNPGEEHRLLGRLVGAAMTQRREELDLAPPPHEVWRSFGVAPRPSFSLRVPVRVHRTVKEAALVLKPPVIRQVSAGTLIGRVLGSDDIPLAGALVKHVDLNVTARTDRRGLFRFSMVPAGAEGQNITVYAKGTQQSFAVQGNEGRDQPMVIRIVTKEA